MARSEIIMSSDEGQLLSALQKIQDNQRKMEQKFGQVGRAAQKAGKQGKSAGDEQSSSFSRGIGKAAKMAAGWLSIGTAIGIATRALREHNEEREKSLDSVERLDEANRTLAQVATSGEDFQALKSRADRLSEKFGISRARSRKLIFSARSEGFEDFAEDAARFDPLVSVEAQAKTAGKVRRLFPDADISAREATALTLVGAQKSEADFETLSRSLPAAAAGGKAAGSTIEETIATLAVGATPFKSLDTSADRIKALGIKLSDFEATKGLGLVGGLKKLRDDPELRKEFRGGSIELKEALDNLIPLIGTIEAERGSIEAERAKVGTREGVLERKLRARLEDPEFQSLQRKRKAKIKTELSAEDRFAAGEGERVEAVERSRQRLHEQEADFLTSFGARRGAEAAAGAGFGAEGIERGALFGRAGTTGVFGRGFGFGSAIDLARDTARHVGGLAGFSDDTVEQAVGTVDAATGGDVAPALDVMRDLVGINRQQLAEQKRTSNAAASAQVGRHVE